MTQARTLKKTTQNTGNYAQGGVGKSAKAPVRVALAGLGRLGRPVAELLCSAANVDLVAVCARREKPWYKNLNAEFVDSPELLAQHPDVDVVVDCLSGLQPSYQLVNTALSNAKHVVSANTMLAAVHGQSLTTVARVQNVTYDWQYAALCGLPLQAMMAGMMQHPQRVTTHMALDVQYVLDRMRIFAEDAPTALGIVRQDMPVDASGKHHWARLMLLQNLCYGTWGEMKQGTPLHLEKLTVEDTILAQHMGGEILLVGEITPQGMRHSLQLVAEQEAHRLDAKQEFMLLETEATETPITLSLPPQSPRTVALGILNSVQLQHQNQKAPRLPQRQPAAATRPTAETLFVRTTPAQQEALRRDTRWQVLQERKRDGVCGAIIATHLPPVELERLLGEGTLALPVWKPLNKQPAALGVPLRVVA